MKDIVSIGYGIYLEEVKRIEFASNSSLSDGDIVIMEPPAGYNLTVGSIYRGKDAYDLNNSSKIIEASLHWKRELSHFLENGNNVFIFLNERYDFWVDSGEKSFSGTGKNQKVTVIVKEYNNYNFLPIAIEIYNASGKKILSKNPLMNSFTTEFREELSYSAYISSKSEKIEEYFSTKTLDKIIGGRIKHRQGSIIFLPYIDPFPDRFYDENEDEITKDGLNFQRKIIQAIIEIDKQLKSNTEKSIRPDWLMSASYRLKKVEQLNTVITSKSAEIEKIRVEIENLEIEKNENEILLDLLFETGKPLEKSVIMALKILGYTAENFNDGSLELDQVIISPEGIRYIGECEGKDNKAIDISKFRQLQDSMNEDFQRDEIQEKAFGLLFGNPHRMVEIENRKDFFTQKCINGADREKIGLVKTTDLFYVAKYLIENTDEEFKQACRLSIHNNLGKIIEFPKIPL